MSWPSIKGRLSQSKKCNYELISNIRDWIIAYELKNYTNIPICTAIGILMFSISTSHGQEFQEISANVNIHQSSELSSSAVADYDKDGDLDIFMVALNSFDENNPNTWSRLLKNNGDAGYEDVTLAAGFGQQYARTGTASEMWDKMGASWGDYDNDGYPDLLLTHFRKVELYHNQGDGTFIDVTEDSGIEDCYECHGSSALWWDYDNDGDLDLYISDWSLANRLFRNDGNNSFTNVSSETGLGDEGQTWASVPIDVNKDGWLDLYVVNDFRVANRLYVSVEGEFFIESTKEYGLEDYGDGMGITIGDYNNDGRFDIYLTNIFRNKYNPFFVGTPSGMFNERAKELGVDNADWAWGTHFFDYDHDGDEDLYVVNGFGADQNTNRLFKNMFAEGINGFNDLSETSGLNSIASAVGMEVFDHDNDGDLDILVSNTHTVADFYENEVISEDKTVAPGWLKVALEGVISNKDAIGTTLEITVSGRKLHRYHHGAAIMAQSLKPVHFGFEQVEKIDRLLVKWPSGIINAFFDIPANQTITIVEDEDSSLPPDDIPTEAVSHSVARKWNELLLESIRNDFARPTVHARNLFHTSMAMYDAWATFNAEAQTIFLGKTFGNYTSTFNGAPNVEDIQAAQEEAISFAAFRILSHRFNNSPGGTMMLNRYVKLMEDLGYDTNITSVDYTADGAAALGNSIAQQLIEFGLQDGSNEQNDYANIHYLPSNEPLIVDGPGNPTLTEPNLWQPLTLSTFIDQSGNVLEQSTPDFLSPEWGQVVPFALSDENLETHTKNGFNYKVYYDPGAPVKILSDGTLGLDDPYKWGFALVAVWSAHLDPRDGVMMDISPASLGNTALRDFPKTFEEYKSYYKFFEGGDLGTGHDVNPITGQPYAPQIVPKGDYARVLAEFWADGPDSETPPGHWYTILNYVSDHPLTEKRFMGKGEVLDDLEWDVKSYLTLGGAMHDVAISAWGIKGYYDYIRPISAIRYMASKGQSTDRGLPSYHPEGIPLIPGYIEVIEAGDPLAGDNNENLGHIKLYAWKGTHFVKNPDADVAGVDWILAENWVPYQRPSFVTPPFAGYVSGHSTFSRAAAEVLTKLTGSNFFPGGMGIFNAGKNRFLVFEDGPSQDLALQWATYQDASDQTSLSRIWGGIHPPIDDIPGRLIGEDIGKLAFETTLDYFYKDEDNDGVYSFEDCDDNNDQVGDCPEEDNDRNKSPEFAVYPVPVEDEVTLNIDFNGSLTYRVYNLYGAIVLSGEVVVQNKECFMNLGSLSTGMYVMVCTNENGSRLVSQKIIKK